jgi:hypothetical protein
VVLCDGRCWGRIGQRKGVYVSMYKYFASASLGDSAVWRYGTVTSGGVINRPGTERCRVNLDLLLPHSLTQKTKPQPIRSRQSISSQLSHHRPNLSATIDQQPRYPTRGPRRKTTGPQGPDWTPALANTQSEPQCPALLALTPSIADVSHLPIQRSHTSQPRPEPSTKPTRPRRRIPTWSVHQPTGVHYGHQLCRPLCPTRRGRPSYGDGT